MSRNRFLVWVGCLAAGGILWIAFPKPQSWVGNALVFLAFVIVMLPGSWRLKPTLRRFAGFLILPAILTGSHGPFEDLDRVVFGIVTCAVIALNAYLTFVRADSSAA